MRLLLLLLILASSSLVRADLPVHCIMRQVLGTWDIKHSALDSQYPNACQHAMPDNLQHTLALGEKTFEHPGFPVRAEATVTLFNYTNAELCLSTSCEPASWTMVYDEYFFVRGLETRTELLLGFKFLPARPGTAAAAAAEEEEKFESYCGETMVGWISSPIAGLHGCAIGRNRALVPPQPSSFSSAVYTRTLTQILQEKLARSEGDEEDGEAALARPQWRASTKAVPKYSGNGRKRGYFVKPNSFALNRITDPVLRARERVRRRCIRQVLPKRVDWSAPGLVTRTRVQSQGACGSCYAVASLDAFISRIQLQRNSTQSFTFADVDSITQCSVENQGCEGGYPWLVGRFAHYRGLRSATCQQDMCSSDSTNCAEENIKARAWGYVGGQYGRNTVEDMMWSLHRDGPLVVGINAPSSLFTYSSGVYSDERAVHESLQAMKEADALWEPSTHAVTLVGYGPGVWKLKNSWGEGWGEQGYFFMPKGRDTMAVESMAVHAIFGDGRPGNAEFESSVREALRTTAPPECHAVIEDMLQRELV